MPSLAFGIAILLSVDVDHGHPAVDLAPGGLLDAHLRALRGLTADQALVADRHLESAHGIHAGAQGLLLQRLEGLGLDRAQDAQVALVHLVQEVDDLLLRVGLRALLYLGKAFLPLLLGGGRRPRSRRTRCGNGCSARRRRRRARSAGPSGARRPVLKGAGFGGGNTITAKTWQPTMSTSG